MEKQALRKKRYARLLVKYEQDLKRRELNNEIKEVTRKTYLNDANRVLESLLAASSHEEIERIMASQQYRGYYKKVIKDLKTIMAR